MLEHYKRVYDPKAKGFQGMISAFKYLAAYAKDRNISIVFAMTPDFHMLKNYPFGFIHRDIAKISRDLGFMYVDLLPTFHILVLTHFSVFVWWFCFWNYILQFFNCY